MPNNKQSTSDWQDIPPSLLFLALLFVALLISSPIYKKIRSVIYAQEIEYEMANSSSTHSVESCLSLGCIELNSDSNNNSNHSKDSSKHSSFADLTSKVQDE